MSSETIAKIASEYPISRVSPDKKWTLVITHTSTWCGYNLSYSWFNTEKKVPEGTPDEKLFYACNWADGFENGYNPVDWIPEEPATLHFMTASEARDADYPEVKLVLSQKSELIA